MTNNLFIIRRISDLDHYLPFARSISTIKKYTESYFIFIGNDISLKSLRSDKRYKILKYLNFHSKNNNILNSYFFFEKFIIKISPKKITNILINSLRFIYSFIFRLRIYLLIFFLKPKNIFLDISYNDIFLKLLKKTIPFKIISLPHGLFLHTGYLIKEYEKIVFPEIKPSKIIDYIILCNNNDKNLLGLNNNTKIIISGSKRYSYEWINFLNSIPDIDETNFSENINAKINILIFEDKSGQKYNGENIPWIKTESLKEVINYLDKFENFNVKICKHPSKRYMEFNDLNVQYSKSTDMTFDLVKNSDIIIGTVGTSILDGLLLNKKVISLSYCHYFKSLFDIYEKNIVINSFDEFKISIEKLTIEIKNRKKTKYKNFYEKIIKNDKDFNFEIKNIL